jgi:hypothetical protein
MTTFKKVRRVIRFRILFLFLSLTTGTGKGDAPKGILLREGNGLRAHYWSGVQRPAPWKGSTTASGHSGSAPTTDQRFEGWPLRGVQQPPQSARAPRPLLVRGSKAGPSEGFNDRLRPLGLRAHYRSGVRRLALEGFTAASDAERGMTLGTFDT